MKTSRIYFFLVFWIICGSVHSQAFRSFQTDSVKFIQELQMFFENIKLKENQEKALVTLDKFNEFWSAESFNYHQKLEIYQTTNLMLQRRIKSYPYFVQYLNTLCAFKEISHDEESFNAWLKGLRESIENRRNNRLFVSLLNFSYELLHDNSLYKTRSHSWKSSTPDYIFTYDTLLKVSFKKFDISCVSKFDSIIIHNTEGTYLPEHFLWKGYDGVVDWTRAGLHKNSVWAKLDNYRINLKQSKFTADSAILHCKKYFDQPLLGTLENKISTHSVSPENVSYPRFESYLKNLYIHEIFKDIDYEGGFSMKGAKIIGQGGEKNDAIFTFKYKYEIKSGYYDLLTARSGSFVINNGKINASRVAVAIHHHDDSIFHPGLSLKYIDENRELSLLRIDKGIGQSPYLDTYHKLDFDCEALYWKMDELKIAFRSTKGFNNTSIAFFVSNNFYSEKEFDRIQGYDVKHPLLIIKEYAKKNNTEDFYIYELAQFMRMPETQVEAQVIRLAQGGFLYYDIDDKRVFIKDKLYNYIDSKNAKTDYDVIRFVSEVNNQDNATLSLVNFDLTIRGVPDVSISDLQNVYIYPAGEEVIFRKNRDFLFSGKIQAGLFDFYASECSFEYDTFRLNLPTIDSMTFMVKSFEKDQNGQHYLKDVETVISNLTGDILIDYPNNKNGLDSYPDYPIFHSKQDAYVYYDIDSIYKDAYNREKFYYYLKPFTIKSLENFSTEGLQFQGHLNSGGIMPDIEEPLTVQPDYSLGFATKTSHEGFPVYGGKGKFTSHIFLSNTGFRGNGTLEYLSSISKSNNIFFFLDSVNSVVQNFNFPESTIDNVEYPEVKGVNLNQHWMPYLDSMIVSTTDSAIIMYNNLATIDGLLSITPAGLTGSGSMGFFGSEIDATSFVYKHGEFFSDTTDFRLNAVGQEGLALSTNIYHAHIDIDNKIGRFKTNRQGSKIEFPVNKYLCFIDEFDWYIEENEIELRNNLAENIPDYDTLSFKELIPLNSINSNFISTHPSQDSLRFFSSQAVYQIETNTLTAEDVRIIKVADAAIFPDDGIITIKKNAEIDPLTGATIIADTAAMLHTITNATVNIESRNKYSGNGNYTYSFNKKEPQIIYLDKIYVDSLNHTTAIGIITVEQDFKLNPRFGFHGDVNLQALEKNLFFDGAYSLIQDCDPDWRYWVKFSAEINPESIYLPVDKQPYEFGYKKLYAAFFHSNHFNRIYPAFLSRKAYYSDTMMFSVDGLITARKNNSEYLITSPDEINIPDNKNPQGKYLKMNLADCKVTANGEIRFGAELGQVKMNSYGRIEYFIITDSVLFDIVLTFDFFFSDEALNYFSKDLEASNNKGVDLSLSKYATALKEILGNEAAEKAITDLNLYGTIRKMPEELMSSIIFSDVKLTYNSDIRSYVSEGPIGVGSINGESVNKYFDGYIEIVRKRSGDVLNVYLEIDRRHWYYFSYSNNLMQSISSQTDFNKIIRDIKSEKRQMETEKGKPAYRYIISTTQKKNAFLKAIKSRNK